MKKTIQIVTIPLNKEGFSKDALIKRQPPQITQYMISDKFSNAITESIWQSQQLLVLSDDEVQEDDIRYSFDDKDWYHTSSSDFEDGIQPCKKIIASYPQIEGTLSISKETVQAWIDAGTPEEGSVTIDKEFDDWYELMELKSYPNWKPVVDTKGNLLLEFGNQIDRNYPEEYELTQEEAKEWCESIQPSVDPIEEAVKSYTKEAKLRIGVDSWVLDEAFKAGWEANPANQTVEAQKEVIKGYQDAVEALKDIIYAYKELVSNTWDDNDMIDFFLFVISNKRYSDDFNEITSLLEKYKQIKDK